MFDNALKSFDIEIYKVAKNNVIKKLEANGLNYQIIPLDQFNKLVEMETKLIKADTKKVGIGIARVGISILTGGLF
jgi:hypothetical protein